MNFYTCVLVVFILPVLAYVHPYHISICQINKNNKTGNLEVTLRIITEDLETTLENKYKKRIFLGDPREVKEINTFLKDYFKEHLKFKIDHLPTHYNYLGKEVEMDITWCYLEIPYSDDFTSIAIQNSILIEVNNEEQFNIVRMEYGGKKKSATLDFNTTETIFKFE